MGIVIDDLPSLSTGRTAISRVALATSMPANNSDAVITTPVRMPYLAGFGLGWPRQLYGLCQARTCRPKLPYGLVKPTLGITAWHARNTSSERPGIISQMTNSRYKGKITAPKMTKPRASGEGCDGDSDLLFHRCELEDGKFDLPSFRLTAKGGSDRC